MQKTISLKIQINKAKEKINLPEKIKSFSADY
jgi:hypothetical protein